MIASKIVAVSRTTLPFHIHRLRLRPAAGALLCTVRAPFCGITRTLTSSTSASSTVSASAPLSLSARRANRASNRAARAATAAQNAINSASSTGSASAPPAVSSGILWNSAIIIPSALIGWYIFSKDDKNSIPVRLLEFSGFNKMWDNATEGFTKPHADKLLPDWPMPNVPPDLPCPHTLVLDLENTLVSSTWDRKHGWRHAKRPGVDQFLRKMAQYYEIVLYTSTIQGVAEPVIQNLDKQQAIMHALYRESTRFIDGVHVKDLSSLNRNVKKIIAIDNDEKALQLHPDNLIRVKPYTDPRNRTDDTLEKIMPILIEIVNKVHLR
uniref:Mitochondrial import inner membrane translocase subunit TIM50 n=1 Tax=Corethron hystrix TaxID=216773 RepID=A0A7S1BYC3_9STRA